MVMNSPILDSVASVPRGVMGRVRRYSERRTSPAVSSNENMRFMF